VNILVLSPNPFYQDRGSPIRLDQILKVLSARGDKLDVLAYHEGREISYDNVTIYRICNIPFMNDLRPGFSWKKVICDIFMFFKTIHLVVRNRYQVFYAVEESVFIALVLKWSCKIPYIYAMDSSLSEQMVASYPFLQPCLLFFHACEKLAVRNAIAVVPVCNALADDIDRYRPKKVVILQDVSLLQGVNHMTDRDA
jgi:hypothetical protein